MPFPLLLAFLATTTSAATAIGWVFASVVLAAGVLCAAWAGAIAAITRLTTHPSWNTPQPPDRGLPKRIKGAARTYYGQWITDPKHDFGLDFEHITIPGVEAFDSPMSWHCRRLARAGRPFILRGWHVPAPASSGPRQQQVRACAESSTAFRLRPGLTHMLPSPSPSWPALPPPPPLPPPLLLMLLLLLQLCIVAVHGGGRDRRAFLRHTPLFHRAGFGAVLFDCRGTGNSDGRGRGMSFGLRESEDVLAAVDYARTVLGYSKVVAVGTSMGATASIIAAARSPAIDGVVAENPFASCEHLLEPILVRHLGPVPRSLAWCRQAFVRTVLRNVVRVVGAGRGDVLNALEMVPLVAPRPLLIIHGTKDDVVHHTQSHLLFHRAAHPKALWIVEDARHTAVYNAAPEQWERRVVQLARAVREGRAWEGADPPQHGMPAKVAPAAAAAHAAAQVVGALPGASVNVAQAVTA